ncbi:hypothetical protein [Clostridium sp. LP20]|uniref:hypothetical protein n=1 Tax=Clostridium sp. LP20 TaxID=3418665 RepID=UPI003EE6E84C
MSCGCSTLGNDGKAIVDLVRSKDKATLPLKESYKIDCSCGKDFTMKTLVDNCPNCGMTYGVTPCSQSDKNNIKAAGINY